MVQNRILTPLRDLILVAEDELENDYEYFQVKGPVKFQREMIRLKTLVHGNMQNGKLSFHVDDGRVLETNVTYKQVKELLPSKWFLEYAQSVALNINLYKGMVGGTVILDPNDPEKRSKRKYRR